MLRVPQVLMEVPFAAESEMEGELVLRSCAEAGKPDTSAPVSIKKD